jgi:hypothetical protein
MERVQLELEAHQVVGWWHLGLRVSGLDPLRERGDHLAGLTCVRIVDTGWGDLLNEVSWRAGVPGLGLRPLS